MKEKIHCRVAIIFIIVCSIMNSKAAKKFFLTMRLSVIIVFLINIHVSASSYGQLVNLTKNNISLKEAFTEIHKQTGYYFIYNDKAVSQLQTLNLEIKNAALLDALKVVFKNQPLQYSIEDKIIVIKPKVIQANSTQVDRNLSGKVLDANDGQPLIGVTVKIKGRSAGTVTNLNGEFSLTVQSDDKILVFTYLGYNPKEIIISQQTNIYNVSMVSADTQLQEVVVAFGTSTKRELTSSVGQVTAKDIDQRPISNLNSALVGAIPGVQTTSGSGQPGSGPSVSIRGFGSVTGNNEPLYVVDGAPFEGEISNINPEDIETISVLKDASSTALYGARAANGIILVTTKKGKRNTNDISVRLTSALSSRGLPDYERVTAYEYFPLMWESLLNGSAGNPRDASLNLITEVGWNPFNVADNEIVSFDGKLNPNAKLLYPHGLSFRDEMQRLGVRNDFSLALSGGSEKSDYYISLNYLDEKGYVIGSDFQRFSGRIKVNAEPRKWIKAGLNLYANYAKTDQANENSGINENPFYVDLLLAPIYPVYQHNPITGAYLLDQNGFRQYDSGDYRPLMAGRNIVAETLFNTNQTIRSSYNANANVDVKFWKDFKFTTTLAANVANSRNEAFDNRIIGDAIGVGRVNRTNTIGSSLNINQLLNYNKTIGNHTVKALVGHENYLNYFDFLTGERRGMAVKGSTALDNFTTVTRLGSYDRFYKTEGYLAKADYSYDGRYILSGSYRRDGSSRFAPGNKWGNFYSLSGAWNIDREKFFKADWVDLLKLRGSFGQVGNDNIGTFFAHQGLYDLGFNNGSEPGAIYSKVETPDLLWETNSNTDIAVEFGLFNNRLNGTVEAYSRQSDNLLFRVSLPVTAGLLTRNVNFGSMRNRGIEIQLNGDIIHKKDFSWNMGINWSTLDNKILSLPAEYENRVTGTRIYTTGRSLHEFWVRKLYGVDPTNGNELYYAADKQNASGRVIVGTDTLTTSGATANAEFYYAGSAIPDFYGSINNVFTYKNVSLQLMFLYQVGGVVFDSDYQSLMHRGAPGRGLHIDALNRWQQYGDVTNVPSRTTTYTMYANDNFLTNASYLNLRTAAVTYQLSKEVTKRLNVKNAKVFVNGENLFITSARKGMDPTQTYQGDPSFTYAPARIVSFGLNVTL